MRAYIDADEILYNAGFASQHPWYEVYEVWHEDDGWIFRSRYIKEVKEYLAEASDDMLFTKKTMHYDPVGLALYNTKQYIERIIRDTKASEVIMYFSGNNNFREDVATLYAYKGSRKHMEKPKHFEAIKAFIHNNYDCISVDNLEADDMLSIGGWRAYKDAEGIREKCHTIICTKDKDLDMVPGLRYNSQHKEVVWVTEREGMEAFFVQLLTGDSTDDIPGLSKMSFGKANAAASLKRAVRESKDAKEMYAHVWYAYYFNTIFSEECVTRILKEIGTLLYMKRNVNAEDWMEMYDV